MLSSEDATRSVIHCEVMLWGLRIRSTVIRSSESPTSTDGWLSLMDPSSSRKLRKSQKVNYLSWTQLMRCVCDKFYAQFRIKFLGWLHSFFKLLHTGVQLPHRSLSCLSRSISVNEEPECALPGCLWRGCGCFWSASACLWKWLVSYSNS